MRKSIHYVNEFIFSSILLLIRGNDCIFNVSDLSVIFVSIKSRKHLSWLFVQKDYYKQEEY